MKSVVMYYELRNGDQAWYALIVAKTKHRAKMKMQKLCEGRGKWTCFEMKDEEAQLALKQNRPNRIYEANLKKLISVN